MLQSLNLKCANCGANLEIKLETETFACGYCGASQIVERYGGTVSLRLVTDAISKVQAGTDRTAAELAIRRLKEEMAETETNYRERKFLMNQAVNNMFNIYVVGFILSCILVCGFSTLGLHFIITIFLLIIVASGFLYSWSRHRDSIISEHDSALENYKQTYRNLKKKFEEQKKIVDS